MSGTVHNVTSLVSYQNILSHFNIVLPTNRNSKNLLNYVDLRRRQEALEMVGASVAYLPCPMWLRMSSPSITICGIQARASERLTHLLAYGGVPCLQ